MSKSSICLINSIRKQVEKMIKPLVSIIIPVKNRSVSLKRALNSILLQTYTHFEVLVVDDKSEEDLVEVVSGFNDPRFKYFLNDMPTSNANVCRNIGLERAQGEYTAMLDSDDEWLPDHLESKIIFIEDNQCDGVDSKVWQLIVRNRSQTSNHFEARCTGLNRLSHVL